MEQKLRLPNETDEQYDIRVNKDVAAFSYVWIMSVVVFAMRRDSKFAQYHSRQGMILFIVSILAWIIPFIGGILVFIPVAGMLMGFINASQGKFADVPFAGPLSRGEMTLKDIWNQVLPMLKRLMETLRNTFTKTGAKPPPSDTLPPTP